MIGVRWKILYFLNLLCDLVEDAVDEGRRFFTAEFLGELDRFIDWREEVRDSAYFSGGR